MRFRDLIGQQLGRYLVQELLGQGGMAAVYQAYDTLLQRTVALKLLYPQYLGDETVVERFRREAITAAQLEHPHIVPIYDVGEQDGLVYIAMKRLSGRSLQDLLTLEQVLPLQQVLQLAQQIGSALDYAHGRGVIHRDIKPGNIMIEPDGRAILTDFGIAKTLDTPALTTSGVIVGTPEYMAPEQIDSTLAPVDQRSDIYALGALLYRALTGQRLFDGSTSQVLLGHLQTPPPAATAANPQLPPGVDEVLARALAKQPAQRYPTAGALVRELAAAATPTLPGQALGPPEREQHVKLTPPEPRTARLETPEVAGGAAAASRGQAPLSRSWRMMPLLLVLLLAGAAAWMASGGLRSLFLDTGAPPQLASAATATRPIAGSTPTAGASPGAGAASASPTPAPAAGQPSATLQPSATAQPATATSTAQAPAPSPTRVAQAEPTRPPPQPTSRPAPRATPQPTPPPATQAPSPIPPSPQPPSCGIALEGGFDLLWHSEPALRDALGCPTETEARYEVAVQYYPNGMLYWWGGSEHIYVFYGHESGTWQAYAQSALGNAQPTYECPPGSYVPVRGFGLLMASYPEIGRALGECAKTPELGAYGALQVFQRGLMLFMPATDLVPQKRIWVLQRNQTFGRYVDRNP